MRYVFKDEDLSYTFDFKVNGDFVTPDNNQYNCKIRKIDGTILIDENIEKNPESDEEFLDSDTVIAPGDINELEPGKLFDSRIIEISFYYKGKPCVIRDSYRITDFYYFTASPKDVRSYYGLNEGELPDEDIDLTAVYLELLQKHGNTFKECLESAGVGCLRANRLIILKGVVQVFSSVRLRVNQQESDGSSKFIRYLNKIDWDALLAAARSEIEELENNLTGEETVSYTDYTPFFLGAVTDAITGEES